MSCPVALQKQGGSTSFNGTTSTIPTNLVSNSVFTTGNGFTIFAKIKPKSLGGANLGMIMHKASSTGSAAGFRFFLEGVGRLGFSLNAGVTRYSQVGKITFNKWHDVIITVAADGTVRPYVNGIYTAQNPGISGLPSEITAANVLTIGNRSGAVDRTFDGLIMRSGIVPRVLTDAEVKNLANFGILPTDTAHFFPLSELPSTYLDTIGGFVGTGANTSFSKEVPTQQAVSFDELSRTALRFDGIDDVISVTSASLGVFSKVAAQAKIFTRNKAAQSILSRAAGFSDRILQLQSDNKLRFALALTSGNQSLLTTQALQPNRSYEISAVYDGARMSIIVNGQVWASLAATGTLVNAGTTWLIGTLGAVEWLNGNIKEMQMWKDTVPTVQQLCDLYFTNVVSREGLIFEYLTNAGAGTTVVDSSGNSNNGTITGATWTTNLPSYPHQVIDESNRASLLFDGVDDFVVLPTALNTSLSKSSAEFTVSTIFYAKDITSPQTIFASSIDTNDRFAITINSGTLRVGVWNGVSWNSGSGGINIIQNKWYEVTVTAVAGFITRVLVNGVVKPPLDGVNPSTGSNAGVFIGKRTDSAQYFNGKVKRLKIWNRALSLAEIESLFFTNAPITENLIASLLLNEGAGLTAFDSSSNSNNGTISGAIWTNNLPSFSKTQISGNLVINGDFSYAPPFIAPTTNNDTVINGTASGAQTAKFPSYAKKLFRWKMNTYNTTSPAVRYEDGALKVSGIQCKERVNLTLGKRVFTDLNEFDDIQYNLIPVKPNTAYVISMRMKTEVANGVGTAGIYGAMFRLLGHSSTTFVQFIRGITGATDNEKIAVTTNWTTYKRTFTTGATVRFMNIDFGIYGDASNYADITAYFDDIVLMEVDPVSFLPVSNLDPVTCS